MTDSRMNTTTLYASSTDSFASTGGTGAVAGSTGWGVRDVTGVTSLSNGLKRSDTVVGQQTTETDGERRNRPESRSRGIEFVYDFKGNVRVRVMDSHSNLIYQMPPELYARMSELLGSIQGSVNTKV